MKSLTRYKFIVGIFTVILIYILYIKNNAISEDTKYSTPKNVSFYHSSETNNIIVSKPYNVTVAVVACVDRLQETLTMLKSAIMFTKTHLSIIVIADDNLIEDFKEKLSEWRTITNDAFNFEVLPIDFPKQNALEWKKLFKPCASQRLFLPSVLSNVDSVLYVDTDTLFLTPVETVWEHFKKMNSSQLAALTPEHEDPNIGWYNRFAKHPYYGSLGVNSGVMLMNLTRMRQFKWDRYVIPIYKKYKLKIPWGDQDIINIIFHYNPDKLYIYSCRYNFRPDHCMYMSVCKSAEKKGVAVLHGSRGFFHMQKQPAFEYIYRAFEEYQIGTDVYTNFLLPLEAYLDLTTESKCGQIKDMFLKNIKKYVKPTDEEK